MRAGAAEGHRSPPRRLAPPHIGGAPGDHAADARARRCARHVGVFGGRLRGRDHQPGVTRAPGASRRLAAVLHSRRRRGPDPVRADARHDLRLGACRRRRSRARGGGAAARSRHKGHAAPHTGDRGPSHRTIRGRRAGRRVRRREGPEAERIRAESQRDEGEKALQFPRDPIAAEPDSAGDARERAQHGPGAAAPHAPQGHRRPLSPRSGHAGRQ